MKTHIILILTIISCNFCYAQQLDKDIEAVKKAIIGTWKSSNTDTTGYYSYQYYTEKHTFTSKKYTVTILCKNSNARTKTMRYYFKKTYIKELGKDIITIVYPEAGKITSYEYITCDDKKLKDFYPNNWENIIIKSDTMTFSLDNSKLNEYQTLVKEKKTNR